MPLNQMQIDQLEAAIQTYNFPSAYWNLETNDRCETKSIKALEELIRSQLQSVDPEIAKQGLANVVYWGNATAGYAKKRMNRFLLGVTQDQVKRFQALAAKGNVPTLDQVRRLEMPQFSGISFISKLLMFLDPQHYCVLDLRLAKLAATPGERAIHQLVVRTQIPVTKNNCAIYECWRAECAAVSRQHYNGRYRAVDIERGFFNLISKDGLDDASRIYVGALT